MLFPTVVLLLAVDVPSSDLLSDISKVSQLRPVSFAFCWPLTLDSYGAPIRTVLYPLCSMCHVFTQPRLVSLRVSVGILTLSRLFTTTKGTALNLEPTVATRAERWRPQRRQEAGLKEALRRRWSTKLSATFFKPVIHHRLVLNLSHLPNMLIRQPDRTLIILRL